MKLRFRESVFLLAAVSLLSPAVAAANTITANSCSSSDVSSAINSAANGDTVVIPNGSCTWTTGTQHEQADHPQRTDAKGGVMLTHSAGSGHASSRITTGSSFSTEVRNLTFLDGSAERRATTWTSAEAERVPLIHDNYFRPARLQARLRRPADPQRRRSSGATPSNR